MSGFKSLTFLGNFIDKMWCEKGIEYAILSRESYPYARNISPSDYTLNLFPQDAPPVFNQLKEEDIRLFEQMKDDCDQQTILADNSTKINKKFENEYQLFKNQFDRYPSKKKTDEENEWRRQESLHKYYSKEKYLYSLLEKFIESPSPSLYQFRIIQQAYLELKIERDNYRLHVLCKDKEKIKIGTPNYQKKIDLEDSIFFVNQILRHFWVQICEYDKKNKPPIVNSSLVSHSWSVSKLSLFAGLCGGVSGLVGSYLAQKYGLLCMQNLIDLIAHSVGASVSPALTIMLLTLASFTIFAGITASIHLVVNKLTDEQELQETIKNL